MDDIVKHGKPERSSSPKAYVDRVEVGLEGSNYFRTDGEFCRRAPRAGIRVKAEFVFFDSEAAEVFVERLKAML